MTHQPNNKGEVYQRSWRFGTGHPGRIAGKEKAEGLRAKPKLAICDVDILGIVEDGGNGRRRWIVPHTVRTHECVLSDRTGHSVF